MKSSVWILPMSALVIAQQAISRFRSNLSFSRARRAFNTPGGALYASFVGEARPDEHLIRLSDDSSAGDEDILRKEST